MSESELGVSPQAAARLKLEYDGSAFVGWARQPGDARTVQGELERALSGVLRRGSVALTVAGRTDAGVHALGQVASYTGEPAPVDGLNALLPEDVSVIESAAAPGFDARRDATSRSYCYVILTRRARSPLQRGRALHWPSRLDMTVLQRCATGLVGSHDFTAFTPTETDHVRFTREVYSAFWRVGDDDRGGERLEFWIEADSFMRHMNRALVGTMLEVGGGSRALDQFMTLLHGAPRTEAGPTAPAHGLYLAGVGYEDERVLIGGEGVRVR